jgi:sulfonate transport system substrate-binding protein
MNKTSLLALIAVIVVTTVISCGSGASDKDKPSVIRLDFATYNPPSLVLKEKGWAEEAFGIEGIKVEWVQSQGSNRALSFLQGNNIDFGSTAGAAALISASNGNPIELI